MNKNAIKNYAIWARNELITRVTQKAFEYGVSKDNIVDFNAENINGKLLTAEEKQQRQKLISEVKEKGFDQVMEEVAYTWFNRFIALRYMEVNNYLPNRVRVFTNEDNEFKPQILDEIATIEFDELDKEKVYELLENNRTEELYKYLLLIICNDMHNYLPGMFETIHDYKVLLFPENLLRNESVLGRLISDLDEDSWLDQVQIIGWMYQYYNSETFDSIYDGDMSRNKVQKHLLPAATELFTPDWVVRYMVDNSLGRLWIDGHEESVVKNDLVYYIEELEQDKDITEKLNNLKREKRIISAKDIKFLDPSMGSGHILVYAFDVLMRIYLEEGWSKRDAAKSILENNLYGLDIDQRAYQLSYFALLMKARSYDRGILKRNINLNIYAIKESNGFSIDCFELLGTLKELGIKLYNTYYNAKILGSIINVDLTLNDLEMIVHETESLNTDSFDLLDLLKYKNLKDIIASLVPQCKTMIQKYHVVVTNPPYLGNSRFSKELGDYVKKYYPDEKADLAMVMLNKILWNYTKENCYSGAITTVSWMYLKSFETFRKKFIRHTDLINLVDFGTELFDGKIGHLPVAAWIGRNSTVSSSVCSIRLVDFCYARREEKKTEFFNKENWYVSNQSEYDLIPGSPIAYWTSKEKLSAFENGVLIGEIANVKIGMGTGKNAIFVRNWWEIKYEEIDFSLKSIEELPKSKGKYFPYNKGGETRKWYGNLQEVIWYDEKGRKLMNEMPGHRENGGRNGYFKEGITWNFIGTSKFGARLMPYGCLFDVAGSALFVDKGNIYYVLGFLESNVCNEILKSLNPTVNYQAGNIKSLPILFNNVEKVNALVIENIKIAKEDWDIYETSWNFIRHPLIPNEYTEKNIKLSLLVDKYYSLREKQFRQLKANEELLNQIFIETYNLANELSPTVEDKDVSFRKPDLLIDIKNLISYAVGCMLGRYSLDNDGLKFAGGMWENNDYFKYLPDNDNIIPICDDEYFEDDIVGRFIEFIKIVYGSETLEENLEYITHILGGSGTSREKLRAYFVNDFFKDHCRLYQKAPIYWLFDSGKKNGFKALVYIHRYTPDLIARMRTQYIHEQQARYRNQIEMLERQIDGDISTSERVRLNKQLKKFKEQDEELRKYEEKIHHWADRMEPMDLDDGVKANYAKFQELLAKIK